MKILDKALEALFLSVYSFFLIFWILIILIFFPRNGTFDFWEMINLFIPLIHIVFLWIAYILKPIPSWLLWSNFGLYMCIISCLLWGLQSSDVNILVYIFVVSWVIQMYHWYRAWKFNVNEKV